MKNFLNIYTLIAIAYSFLIFSCAGSKKSKVDPFIGEWEYTVPSQDGGEMDVVMTISKTENEYSGFLSSYMGSVDLEELVIEEGKLSARFDFQGYELSMKGAFEGDTYNGTTAYEDNEWPMIATKKKNEE